MNSCLKIFIALLAPLATVSMAAAPAEREALEPILSRNIIKSQITDNHIPYKGQSKSKSF